MGDWQDWDGDGNVDDTERAFTFMMMDDMDKQMKKNGGGCLSCILLFLFIVIGSVSLVACASKEQEPVLTQEEKMEQDAQQHMEEAIHLMQQEKYKEACGELKLVSEDLYPEVWALMYYTEANYAEQQGETSSKRAELLYIYIPDDYEGIMKKELLEYRDYYMDKYGPKEEEEEETETADDEKEYGHGNGGAVVGSGPDLSEFADDDDWEETPSKPSKPTKKEPPYDPYDVYDYSDPEDFYYDNYDDFWEYEEAEEYYYDAWEKYEQ